MADVQKLKKRKGTDAESQTSVKVLVIRGAGE